jgi:hypothetical protein
MELWWSPCFIQPKTTVAYSKLAYPVIDNYPHKITLHKNNNSVHPPHKIH